MTSFVLQSASILPAGPSSFETGVGENAGIADNGRAFHVHIPGGSSVHSRKVRVDTDYYRAKLFTAPSYLKGGSNIPLNFTENAKLSGNGSTFCPSRHCVT